LKSKLTPFLLFLFLSASIFVYAEKNPGSGFTQNKGQFRDQAGKPNPDVLYMADFGGMKVQLRKTGFSYETYQVKPKWVDPVNILFYR